MNEVKKPKASYFYKLFRVRRQGGKVTTVSVDPVLVTHAIKQMGGVELVGAFVRETALSYDEPAHKPRYKSCSGFVAEMLRQRVREGGVMYA